jgi:tRNA dimethylallyltransferase
VGGVLVLAGPTASGKTDLAIALAKRFDAEIISADSRQIYRGMPIGTAAPTAEQVAAVPHHLVAFLDPHERYSAARFARDAIAAIEDIHARGHRAIVVGGTGFYVRALTGGVALAPERDEVVRDRLAREAKAHPSEFLHGWLAQRDPSRAAALDPNDTYRILRALEVTLSTTTARDRGTRNSLSDAGIPFAKLFVDIPLDTNDARIDARTRAMIAGGLLAEAETIGADAVAADAVGYPQALAYLRGWSTGAELEATLTRATRRYARRQRAWFRSEPDVRWVSPDQVEPLARELLGWA